MIEDRPRKRSNSLPIPKIEISFHDSPMVKRKYNIEYSAPYDQKGTFVIISVYYTL